MLDSGEFKAFSAQVRERVAARYADHRLALAAIGPEIRPNDLIASLGDDLLDRFKATPLLDPYDIYERLLTYWHDTMHDDVAMVLADGWYDAAKPRKTIEDKERELSETPNMMSQHGLARGGSSGRRRHWEGVGPSQWRQVV